jgi:anti-anti-sigma factor
VAVPATNPRGFRFGPFVVDLETAELRKNNRSLRLQDKPFQLLVALLEQKGKLVSREGLRRRLWPNSESSGTFVDFDNGLNTAVSKLREVLGDVAEEPRYIETLARRGYRFVGSAEEFGAQLVPSLRQLEIQVKHIEPDIAVVEIKGRITFGPECHQVEWLTAELLRQNEKKIVFDVSNVDRIDSTGVGIVIMSFAKVRETGGKLCVAGAKGDVAKVLKMTTVDTVPLHGTTAEAVEVFAKNCSVTKADLDHG